jgi:hypothetical protein
LWGLSWLSGQFRDAEEADADEVGVLGWKCSAGVCLGVLGCFWGLLSVLG